MTQDTTNIWVNMQALLEEKLSRGHYNVWVAPLRGEYLASPLPLLKIFAPTSFVASKIKEEYLSAIKEAAQSVAGCEVTVEIAEEPSAEDSASAEGGASSASGGTLQEGRGGHGRKGQSGSRVYSSAARRQELAQFHQAGSHAQEQMGLPLNTQSALLPLHAYSFENFVVGPSNQLAYAAARSLTEAVIQNVQSLFLNSGPGLGKTHLLQSIAHELKKQGRSSCRIACLTAEEFTSRFIASIRAKDTGSFKARYRDLDVLLLEDIQFLQGKEKSQEEVLSTIKSIRERGGRVVFSSSFAPEDLNQLDTQLTSRFCSGFLASILPPGFETRCHILSSKAAFYNTTLPTDVTELLAENMTNDIRKIESALQNLILQAKLLNSEISLELAMAVIKQYSQEVLAPCLENIISTVCNAFAIKKDDIASKTRRADFVAARNTIFFLARRHTNLTLAEIGRHLNRTHTSVLKGISSLEREIKRQTPLGNQLEGTIRLIEKQF